MQTQSLQIFDYATIAPSGSPPTVDGPWIDVSNLVSLSIQINDVGSASIEVSNDPNVNINGPAIGAPSAAPILSQFPAGMGFQSGVSLLAGGSFSVQTTFTTKWGETTASAAASLVVDPGNYLFVAAPVPTVAQAPSVTGWNVYVQVTSGSPPTAGNYALQTGPQYQPQRVTGSGFGVAPLNLPSINFAVSGALPLVQNFSMLNGFQQTQWVPPSTDNSGGVNSGVNVGSLTTSVDAPAATFYSSPNAMWTTSCMCFKWLRVVNGGSTTTAYLMGQRG